MLGVLCDGKGVECPVCSGQCSDGEENCAECEGEGRIYPDTDDLDGIDDARDYLGCLRLIYGLRERPMTATEALSQPAKFAAAWEYVAPKLFGELEDRRDELNAR